MSSEENAQLKRMLLSSLVNRSYLANQQTFGGLRDVWGALGYPSDGKILFEHYWLKYKRQDIAKAIVDKPVEGSWRQLPVVSAEGNDAFQDAWEALEEQHGIYRTLIRADTMSRIGQYAVVMLGFGDDDLMQPPGNSGELLYLQPYLQDHAEIKTYVQDQTDPRFGLPELYDVQVSQAVGEKESTQSTVVHHSRILHIADNLIESNVFGIPALECVWNRLQDLELISGGSAEMFWRGAFPGMAFKVQDGASLSTADKAALDDEIQKYLHDFERYLKTEGLDIEQLTSQVADPAQHIDAQIKFISIATGIPKRILEGSERGELASSTDAESWNNKCDTRRRNHIENNILRPFIGRLGDVGVLDVPDSYDIEWPDLESQSDEAKAKVAKDRVEAIVKYADSPTAPLVVPQRELLADILELPEEKVDRIMEAAGDVDLGELETDNDDEIGFTE